MGRRRAAWVGGKWVFWLGAVSGLTAIMLPVRASLDKAHLAFVYLLLVLGASARAGRSIGLTVSVLGFFAFNFFFVPPYHTLVVADPRDWIVLAAFLLTSATAAQLLARASAEATAASERADEVDRLSTVGAEALNAGRAEEALAAIATVIRDTLRVERCEMYERGPDQGLMRLASVSPAPAVSADEDPGFPRSTTAVAGIDPDGQELVEWVANHGRVAVEQEDGRARRATGGSIATDAEGILAQPVRAVLVPLRVSDRIVGVLRLASARPWMLDPPRRRVLGALSYYAALGVERVRLVAEGEHADALRHTDELKNALLASVSHDLRTPLTTIKALAHDIRCEGDGRAAIIEEEADRLNRLVGDLLDLSRLAAGGLGLTPDVTAVEDLLGAALQQVSGAPGGRDIVVLVDPAEPLLLGRFDFVHSLRMLVNVIENALKHAPQSPVEVSARLAGQAVEIIVADRGPGVEPSERERIFEPFYRPQSSAGRAAGAGLGLSIARSFAEAQDGSLRYEPRDDGGSRFVITLPAAGVSDGEGSGLEQSL